MIKPNTTDEMIEVCQAIMDGKQIQSCATYENANEFRDADDKEPNFAVYHYRIKPAKKTVPWTQDDVPPVCWVRWVGDLAPKSVLVTEIRANGIMIRNGSFYDFHQCARELEHSTDLKTWKPCTKEVLE